MEFYSELIHKYQQCSNHAEPISIDHVNEAILIISNLFPPRRALTAMKLLAALNLLNAAVKLEAFKPLVSYKYVKGMCAYLLYFLLVKPTGNIDIWLDRIQNITYFRVMGVQFSFHFVPLFRALRGELTKACLTPQVWDGLRLQQIAVEVLRMVQPKPFTVASRHVPTLSTGALTLETERLAQLVGLGPGGVKVCSQPFTTARNGVTVEKCPGRFVEDGLKSLYAAITFNMHDEQCFMLYRRKDRRPLRVIRYDGHNYDQLLDYLMVSNKRVWRRRRATLEVGKLYCLSPQQRIRTLSPAAQLLAKTRNSYLVRDGLYNNLCLSYPVACYLAQHFPTVRFVKTLNFNRLAVRHTLYDIRKLRRVPLASIARHAKVWVVVDKRHELAHFDLDMLPQELIDDYLVTDDFYKEFQVERRRGLKGLRAWHYHWLLPPLFPNIRVRNYHALVQGYNQKWAVFSLCEECFQSGFIYDTVCYDRDDGCIYGLCGNRQHVIVRFNYNEY